MKWREPIRRFVYFTPVLLALLPLVPSAALAPPSLGLTYVALCCWYFLRTEMHEGIVCSTHAQLLPHLIDFRPNQICWVTRLLHQYLVNQTTHLKHVVSSFGALVKPSFRHPSVPPVSPRPPPLLFLAPVVWRTPSSHYTTSGDDGETFFVPC